MLRLVLGKGLVLAVIGSLLGVTGATAGVRLLTALAAELPAHEPIAVAALESTLRSRSSGKPEPQRRGCFASQRSVRWMMNTPSAKPPSAMNEPSTASMRQVYSSGGTRRN